MNTVYYVVGCIVFWAVMLFSCFIVLVYALSAIKNIRARFWIYQVYERYFVYPEAVKKLTNKKQLAPDERLAWTLHGYKIFADKSYRHYRRSIQLYRKFYVKKFKTILDAEK